MLLRLQGNIVVNLAAHRASAHVGRGGIWNDSFDVSAVAGQAAQEPIAVFKYDDPTSPTQKIICLTVYATAAEMPRWSNFVMELEKLPSSGR